MKKIIITASPLSAMLGFSQEIHFCAKAGLNISSLRGDYPNGIDEKKPVIVSHWRFR